MKSDRCVTGFLYFCLVHASPWSDGEAIKIAVMDAALTAFSPDVCICSKDNAGQKVKLQKTKTKTKINKRIIEQLNYPC